MHLHTIAMPIVLACGIASAQGDTMDWDRQAAEDAGHDRTTIAYDGISPNKLVCDTTLRVMPDGSWAMFMLAGDDFEPSPKNYIGITRSTDEGKTWTEHGNVRLNDDDRYHGWAEPAIVELSDGRIVMIIRADRLGGVLYRTESTDGGRTWPELAVKTDIPNHGSKASLFSLGGDVVALAHNPNPKHRSPLALWISFDGMKTWPYRRVIVPESCDGPKGRLNYPDGFVSKDRQWLHIAYDDNRHRAVYYGAKLPPLP